MNKGVMICHLHSAASDFSVSFPFQYGPNPNEVPS